MSKEKTYSTNSPIYILTWNPKTYDWGKKYDRICFISQHFGAVNESWFIQIKAPRKGDRFILLRQGMKDGNGIIGYGHIKSDPYKYIFYMDVVDISIHRLFRETLLARDELEKQFPDQYWRPNRNGIRLKQEYEHDLWKLLRVMTSKKLVPIIR